MVTAPPRVLIVEDERAIQLALRGLLRRAGYEVECAGSAQTPEKYSEACRQKLMRDKRPTATA